jgi:hypothetical protein
MKLKEIRDDELHKEDGFATWTAYLKDRWDFSKRWADQTIEDAKVRDSLPPPSETGSTASHSWSQRAVQEIARIKDKRDAARVAKKIVAEVEKNGGLPNQPGPHFLTCLEEVHESASLRQLISPHEQGRACRSHRRH